LFTFSVIIGATGKKNIGTGGKVGVLYVTWKDGNAV